GEPADNHRLRMGSGILPLRPARPRVARRLVVESRRLARELGGREHGRDGGHPRRTLRGRGGTANSVAADMRRARGMGDRYRPHLQQFRLLHPAPLASQLSRPYLPGAAQKPRPAGGGALSRRLRRRQRQRMDRRRASGARAAADRGAQAPAIERFRPGRGCDVRVAGRTRRSGGGDARDAVDRRRRARNGRLRRQPSRCGTALCRDPDGHLEHLRHAARHHRGRRHRLYRPGHRLLRRRLLPGRRGLHGGTRRLQPMGQRRAQAVAAPATPSSGQRRRRSRYFITSLLSAAWSSGPAAMKPSSLTWRRLKRSGWPWMSVITPPASASSAAPEAISHSLLGVRVKVASALPAATRASLYATLPIGLTMSWSLYAFHSPRAVSLRLATTTARASPAAA